MFRYRLRTLLAVTTLCAAVAACLAFEIGTGIIAYIVCLLLFMITWRIHAARATTSNNLPATIVRPPSQVLLGAIAVTVAAGIAFCTTCTIAQMPAWAC